MLGCRERCGMSDEKPEVGEIVLTPKERAAVNAALELADGFAALGHGTPAEAAEHFAAAERWTAAAKQAGTEP